MTTKKNDEGNGVAMGIAMMVGSLGVIALCVCGIFALVKCVPERKAESSQVSDTITIYEFDTIPYYEVMPKDSIVVRYITEKLPIANRKEANSLIKSQLEDSVKKMYSDSVKDSVNVVLPITQKHYEDSTFSAWVSGYEPNLDSIKVYQRKEIQTITITTKEQKRWSIGVSGGIGVVYDGGWHCGPGINIGVTYSF
jgi:hypothetical protein